MKIIVDKEKLVQGIQVVQNIVNQKSNLPILSYLLLEANNNSIHLTTTDLDVGITHQISAQIEESGSIILPTKKFGDIIKEFPNDTINIYTRNVSNGLYPVANLILWRTFVYLVRCHLKDVFQILFTHLLNNYVCHILLHNNILPSYTPLCILFCYK